MALRTKLNCAIPLHSSVPCAQKEYAVALMDTCFIQTSGQNFATAALHIRDRRRVEPRQNSMTKILSRERPWKHKGKASRAVPRTCIPSTFSQMLQVHCNN